MYIIYIYIYKIQTGGRGVEDMEEDVTQFYRISKSKALFCPEFTRAKVEFLGVIKKKSC